MNATDLITADPEILGGRPVFKGTRVPVKTLFEYLADSLSLDYFLESFPSVSREQAVAVLRFSLEDHRAAGSGVRILLDECVHSGSQRVRGP
ncbi:MAG: DUF433 domain-containing protein [Verrucomicrobiota bacterium]|nr:DUF433 domain-containing protein [Verrucomicrobiota bacterium]